MTASLLVMRHGEKSGDPNDPHLTVPGLLRAKKLASYVPSTFGVPTFIFATAISLHSNRPYETVKPLADAVGVPIDATFADQDYGALAIKLRTEVQFRDTVGVVCWHHGNIPSLMNALIAVDGQYPNPRRSAADACLVSIADLLSCWIWIRGQRPSRARHPR